ncbi:MAG: hypothetical protein HKM24_00600, partial [Gammaproteobacteria bacterium]|nr:hypothetical protein [Gammaproteobacteria bacterium]
MPNSTISSLAVTANADDQAAASWAALRAVIEPSMTAVERCLQHQLSSDVALIRQIGHYLVDSGGKRIRPMVTLLASGASQLNKSNCTTGDSRDDAMSPESDECFSADVTGASLIEFIHTATLLHDDVVDQSDWRRGQSTANRAFGNAASVLVGDFVYSRSFQMMVELNDMAIMRLLADTTNTIASGEVMQLVHAHRAHRDESIYFDVIHRKTAALFAAAAKLGGLINYAKEDICQALDTYGQHLGLAFQLADDCLDFAGDPENTGKSLGDDLAEGTPTLPLIYVLNNGNAEQSELVRTAIEFADGPLDEQTLNAVIEIVHTTGALNYVADKAQHQSKLAIEALSNLPNSQY